MRRPHRPLNGPADQFQGLSRIPRGKIDGPGELAWAGAVFHFEATKLPWPILAQGRIDPVSTDGSCGWVWVAWPLVLGSGNPPGAFGPVYRGVQVQCPERSKVVLNLHSRGTHGRGHSGPTAIEKVGSR